MRTDFLIFSQLGNDFPWDLSPAESQNVAISVSYVYAGGGHMDCIVSYPEDGLAVDFPRVAKTSPDRKMLES